MNRRTKQNTRNNSVVIMLNKGGSKVKPSKFTTDLNFITPSQASRILKMFDSPEAYAENFAALKAITRGLYKLIDDNGYDNNDQVARMFQTVNRLQGILLLDDIQEVDRILRESSLMPDPWFGFRGNGEEGCNVK
ncbi:hypothetical protein H9X96_03140 [Pedobacter sp. N36a]|uniref:hypothetical protein n=1 Tax=Pedobacter sp. N36a TaxID=2767996 RepID=UPI0016573580|nr:hypothetical protein [Pedobacter sp. N36a]MBC8984765.1 hypothetical protein [Pedobacter sp. N36a]